MARMMRITFIAAILSLNLGAAASASAQAADKVATPDFKEVQQVIRENLSGATDESVNRASVEGLLLALKGRASLVTNTGPLTATTNLTPRLARKSVFDGSIGYVRIARVEAGLASSLASAVQELASSNKLSGVVLDLRFAGGDDYTAAADVVDLFLSKDVPLLNAGAGLISSKEKTNAIHLPVVALLNGETMAAAEATAAALRQTGAGLLIGTCTAGRAGVTRDFNLSTGQILRVVIAPVQLGDAKAIPATGVAPDIEVTVKRDDELAFFDDPYGAVSIVQGSGPRGSKTNNTALSAIKRVRVTEADLVRERQGDNESAPRPVAVRAAEPSAPGVRDPVLLRAIDLLKGLSVVRRGRF